MAQCGPTIHKAFFSEDGSVLFLWLDTGTLEWMLIPLIHPPPKYPPDLPPEKQKQLD